MEYSIIEVNNSSDYLHIQESIYDQKKSLDAFENSVQEIVKCVQNEGKKGLFDCIYKYDLPSFSVEDKDLFEQQFCVDSSLFSSYQDKVDPFVREQIQLAADQIRTYQQDIKKQMFSSSQIQFNGEEFDLQFMSHRLNQSILGQIVRPLSRVGVYIPAGTAPLVSTVLMTALVAQVAGVKDIVVATPPQSNGEIHPAIVFACEISGVSCIYKMGGAHGVTALAHGIDSLIQPVDKIVGPGNIYVALAKKALYGHVDIDMVAGPSEVLILADENTPCSFVALDLLAQLEHDSLSSAQLIAPSYEYVNQVIGEIEAKVKTASRMHILEKSLSNLCFYIVKDKKIAIDLINLIAPEHLSLSIQNPSSYIPFIHHAGAVFLGHYSPEAVGDYCAGPSHVLPTSGSARFFSGLNLSSFMKSMSVIGYHKTDLMKEQDIIVTMAQLEGLDMHAKSVKERF